MFYYAIKYDNIGLLRYTIWEVHIVMHAPSASKPKHAKDLLWQLHIIDTAATNVMLQETYLANALVNLWELPHTFYEIDLLLEHQNSKFKQFCKDQGSFLQEINIIFRQHALTAKFFQKMRPAINKNIVSRQHSWDRRHPDKNTTFDI